MAYTKLFSSIVTSTIWTEDDRTRIVWITMLACADRNGEVQASVPGLARVAGVPVEDCRAAIQRFLSPDTDSRTKDDEGRRIEEIEGGWHLLNYRKYREMASDEDRRAKAAERQQRARAKKSRNSHAPVTPESRQIPQAEAEAEADSLQAGSAPGVAPKRKAWIQACANHSIPEWYAEKKFDVFDAKDWHIGRTPAVWTKLVRLAATDFQNDGAPQTPPQPGQRNAPTNRTTADREFARTGIKDNLPIPLLNVPKA